ncbi:hypothetical protein HDV62DRAFT_290395 [Trichoderma sp. SZMC 28011]
MANTSPPPKLTFAKLNIKPDRHDASFHEAFASVKAYWSQATEMKLDECKYMIKAINEGLWKRGKTQPWHHALYKKAKPKGTDGKPHFNAKYLLWPDYLILNAIYHDNLPKKYLDFVMSKFHTTKIRDESKLYFRIYWECRDEKEEIERLCRSPPPPRSSSSSDESDEDTDSESDDQEVKFISSRPRQQKRKERQDTGDSKLEIASSQPQHTMHGHQDKRVKNSHIQFNDKSEQLRQSYQRINANDRDIISKLNDML